MSTEATLYIPTWHRGTRQETWDWLPPRWRERTFLVTGPDEDESDMLDMLGFPVLHCSEYGLGAKRQWLLENHDASRGDTLLMMDDDFRFGVRRTDMPKKFESPPRGSETVGELLDAFEETMNHCAFGGLAPRAGGNFNVEPYRLNTRINGAWGIRQSTALAEGIRLDASRLQEDFATTLQYLTRGYPTLLLNKYVYMDIGNANATGGCSEYRDDLGQELSVLMLHYAYPDFVTPVEKKGWQGMADTRLDVRIAWKRAYEYGVRWRAEQGLDPIPVPTWGEHGELLPLG